MFILEQMLALMHVLLKIMPSLGVLAAGAVLGEGQTLPSG
jgi:hypothetical protein